MPLSADLLAAIDHFCAHEVVLVASDFDGVLAPFVQDPMAARALPGTIEALETLAGRPQTHAAVVSGRDLDTLTQLTGLAADSPVTRIGAHGAQTSRAKELALDSGQAQLLKALTADLEAILARHPGARLEHKPTATVLHTRGLPEPDAAAAADAALETAALHTGVSVLQGKRVVEMSVVRADKGSALAGLAQEVGADAVAYFGDDVTDEHAFEMLGNNDLTVKVGAGMTAARLRVGSPADVALALEEIVARR